MYPSSLVFARTWLRGALVLSLMCGAATAAAANKLVNTGLKLAPIRGTATHADIRGELALITRTYSDKSKQRYLWAEIKVPVPYPDLEITSEADARKAQWVLSYSRANQASPYAQCTLPFRRFGDAERSSAAYALGLKSTGPDTLIRWGVCDQPGVRGYDSTFPQARPGDTVTLRKTGGPIIWTFKIPAGETTANTGVHATKVRSLVGAMEGGSFKVR
jgi:hypothetical protein